MLRRSTLGFAFSFSLTLSLAACGRSDLLGFDNGDCPQTDPYCWVDSDGGVHRTDGGIVNKGDMSVDRFGDGGMTFGDGGMSFGDGGMGFGDGGMSFGDGGNGKLDMTGAGSPDMRPVCVPTGVEVCNNFADDDCNGFTDCQDKSCLTSALCIDKKTEVCDDSDHDGDPTTECTEPECYGDPACVIPGREICNNLIDDNQNGLTDCADPQCVMDPVCKPTMGTEICNNGIDDNGDGLIDCADPQCITFPACLQSACTAEVDFGAIAAHGADVVKTIDTTGAVRRFNTCAAPGGTARVGIFSIAQPTDLTITAAQAGSQEAHVVDVFRAGVMQNCDANPIFCLQLGQMKNASHTFQALPAGSYFVVVQSYTGTQGPVTVTLSTGVITNKKEICGNGVDDDKNGLTDCQDLACVNDPTCATQECVPDVNLGVLQVGATPVDVKFDTRTQGGNRWHPTCAGTSNLNDYVIRVVLPVPAHILVNWTQHDGTPCNTNSDCSGGLVCSGHPAGQLGLCSGDHIISIFNEPPPGLGCDAFQTSCYDPTGSPTGTVFFATTRAAGSYLVMVKARTVPGPVDLKISLFTDRGVEICNNGIDDDGNGLTDCADPQCYGVGNCKAPNCVVDYGPYTIDWNTQQQVNVDTTNGKDLYQSKCAQGSGREKVIRVTLVRPMALGFNCTENGDMVIQLDQQVNPLDLCDANKLVCADIKALPFGCNYAVPNLQPGQYNVIVQAFASGTEGTMNLTLYGIEENTPEICNNGIDDDMDGFTDCADRKCVTSPLCQQFQCRADVQLGLLPLDNSPTSAVVQTSNKADNNTLTPCVTTAGGKDAVIDFQMPSQGDLTIEWAQVGNHDFALYEDSSDLLACEANPLTDCHQSMGTATGSYTLSKLAGKRYHLVVDADAPGKEGGVVLQLSGLPHP